MAFRYRPVYGLVVLALALLAARVPVAPASADPGGPEVVHTETGPVRGVRSDTDRSFLGIPFAAAPVGPLRWQPPAPPESWHGVRDATSPGNACPQSASFSGAAVDTEDCLNLNVFTPRHESHGLPVIVFIHGGYMVSGSGREYSAHRMIARRDVVVVTVNYRLGALGGLSLAGGADGIAGDYGVQDQQAALRWVQRNIAAFGGDPHEVTIDGQSAGAVSVCTQLGSPLAAGLFQRAIVQSAPCVGDGFGPWPTRDQADRQGQTFAAAVGCPDPATAPACLRAKPVGDLLAAQSPYQWFPDIDGEVLTSSLREAFDSGHFNKVPVLITDTRDEERLMVVQQYGYGTPLTAEAYPQAVRDFFGADRADQVIEHYPLADYDQPVLAYAAARSDYDYICGVPTTAGLLTRHIPAYAAEFADETAPALPGIPAPSFPLGAAHASDLPYLYETSNTAPAFTEAQRKLSDSMIDYWTAFARTGDPNGDRRTPAPRFDPASQAMLRFTETGPQPYTRFAADHHCAFWDSYITW
ncbi:carboxylesterase/lipase family protein [Nocardia concava]|uniref:carboxylesterase/lipase family protein n=1 Tax=Nocardia concava TaxID=257281 RepID=UPI000319575C|nr:carboxylesterase family protein [Nocardia concava]